MSIENEQERGLAACAEHVELVLDDYVDLYEEAPDVVKLDDGIDEGDEDGGANHFGRCRYCEEIAVYLVKRCR